MNQVQEKGQNLTSMSWKYGIFVVKVLMRDSILLKSFPHSLGNVEARNKICRILKIAEVQKKVDSSKRSLCIS